MLLFGGNLSGGKKASSAAVVEAQEHGPPQSIGDRGSQKATLTPHTDALHRLTNHELRLLEELERTRSKLQTEWRLKVASLQRQHPDALSTALNNSHEASVPGVEELEQRFQLAMGGAGSKSPPQNGLKHAMHSKTLKLSPNQRSKSFLRHKKTHAAPGPGKATSSVSPNARTGLDMLPVLTTTGETPFEVGLEAQGLPGLQQQQFVLPVFRLPSVNVVTTASAMAAKEVQAIKEDVDRKQASESLGLSVEEIEALEAELNGQSTSASSSSSPSFHQPNQPSFNGQKLPGLARGNKKRRQQQLQLNGRKSIERSVQAKKDARAAENGGALRKELESALYSVQHLTRLVKDDICWAQKICPASELRTTLYFKRWGREKAEHIFRRLLYNLQGEAMERWKQAVAYEKQQEKLQAYLLYKGSKKLDTFLRNWSDRKLRQAWTKWWSDIVHAKALERSGLELQSIQVIQRSWRAYRGRMLAYLVKMQKLIAKQTTAAIKMQRMFRGGIARKFFKLKRLDQRRQAMAIRIQALARGYIVRKRVKHMREQRKMHLVASRVQALYRGRKARCDVAIQRRSQHLTKAAVRIQRRYRGRLGRATFLRRRLDRMRHIAATKIQTMVRGRRARRILATLREEERSRQAIRRAAAVNIQRVYRGHRARLSTELKLLALRERNRLNAQAATKIQKMARRRQAIHRVDRLRQERAARFVVQARTWVEYWNDEAAKWFYYNQETGEALWAPPATGYTKADGKLVLQDGKIIDPSQDDIASILAAQKAPPTLNGGSNGDTSNVNSNEEEEEEEEEEDDEDKLCVECEEEDARRKCAQCEDVFCDACYEKLHHSAKREKHTWKAIGSLRCIECEKMRATRWCSVCEDPYCLGCFTIIHSKGNKVNHQWTDMVTFKKAARKKQQMAKDEESAQTYDEFVQSSEYQYVTEYAVAEAAREAREAQAYAQSYNQVHTTPAATADYDGWMTLVDEASGQTYYYNSFTGESRWA
ncbi:hypothetical protein PHYPSEUDO_007560 [Phytophthora pseudosyringae]|uniref:WW domain-containing protein n=1 Tax=Phytophthora pseudosyringae TaxID=221518 RepID=A0A8T1VLL3_9STRA|nr:hypothetical protein PHYPSEUDO_007560 [Phytophthora pseudosyringae]